jgi:large repetitive protein
LKPAFDWSDVAGATGYTIQVSIVPTFLVLVVNKVIGTATPQYIPTVNLPAGILLYWRVRANGTNEPSAWSVETLTMP